MENETKKDDKFVFIGIIIILIIILTFRVVSQGKKMNESIKNLDSEDVSLLNDLKDDKKETISLDKNFTTPDNQLSFNYPSEWREVENEDLLNLFNPSSNNEFQQEIDSENLENLQDITTLNNDGDDKNSDILFIAIKSNIPQFSLGVLSIQKINLEEKKIENLEKKLEKELTKEEENTKREITKKEKGDYFISLEVVTYIDERAAFKSKNVGLITKEGIFLITLNSTSESWDQFKDEFSLIISSIDFKKDD